MAETRFGAQGFLSANEAKEYALMAVDESVKADKNRKLVELFSDTSIPGHCHGPVYFIGGNVYMGTCCYKNGRFECMDESEGRDLNRFLND